MPSNPVEDIKKDERPWASVGLLLDAARPEKRQMLWGVLWLLVAAGLEALGPIIGKQFIDAHLLPRQFDLPAMALLLGGLLACGLTAWGLLNFYYIEGYGYGRAMTVYGYSLVSWSFGLLLLAGLCPSSSLARWRLPGAASLALWSYSIYLTHKAIMFALPKFLLLDRQSGATLLAIALACLAVGWLLYRLVELPFMNWRDRRVPSSFKPARAAEPSATYSPRPT